ncbi:MAG: adenine-specific methyltransferase EcoRI family protein [Clostridiales Family XIII bacterium]|jgi:hypothetical protein|nr:adenine-specific methyltransferase EcoRI family protein [Clostridiales Family XIII bacterium]
MANSSLTQAKSAKNDEFYTQWADIEREVQAYLEFDPNIFRGKTILCPCDDPEWSNFTKFFALHFHDYSLKKLISTSYAVESKNYREGYQLTLFEQNDPKFDADKTRTQGKIFVLDSDDINRDGVINIDDLKWDYLDSDGDFRSTEVLKLRDEADIIITNPPFSMFREFLAWIVEADKFFLIIGNMNATTYKEVFPLIMSNKMWLGNGFHAGNAYFSSPALREYADGVYNPESGLVKFRNCCWFTNIDHGRRHQPLPLMTMADNLKFSKHKELKGKTTYGRYDNYDAIEVPFTDAIPSDYDGVMGVPISFLDKYCPEQFNIVGTLESNAPDNAYRTYFYTSKECSEAYSTRFGKKGIYDLNASGVVNGVKMFKRILIKAKGAAE